MILDRAQNMTNDHHRISPRGVPQASLLPPGKTPSTLTVLSSSQARSLSGAHKTSSEFSRHPGYSLNEWKRVCDAGGDLAGVGGRLLRVTPEELSRHQSEDDVWTSVRGRVYNITPFLKFHPGGKAQLLRGAGIDCTELFDKLHTWVNDEAILKKCLVGLLVPSVPGTRLHPAGGGVGEEKKEGDSRVREKKKGGDSEVREKKKGGDSEEEQVISMVVPKMRTLCIDGKYETEL